jgi:uncharacterized membrane protein
VPPVEYHALKWTDGAPAYLPEPSGFTESTCKGVNASGQIVGYLRSREPSAITAQYACIWDEEGAHNLMLKGHVSTVDIDVSRNSRAFDINNDSITVGWAFDIAGKSVACIWNGGIVANLNTLLRSTM